MSATTTHTAWCTDHVLDDESGYCQRIVRPVGVEGYRIDVAMGSDGIVSASPYSERTDDEFNGSECHRIAQAFLEAARIVDAAALPSGTGTTLDVAAVAMLAQVDQFDVRQAINAHELAAHRAVDGTPRLLVEFHEATTWAKARRNPEPLPCDGWDSCPTPGHKHG